MAKRSLLDGPLIPAVVMLVVTGLVAYTAAVPAALIWFVIRPHHFHERPFDQDRWSSFAAYEAANGRGEMYDDLVARRLLRAREAATGVVALLGDADERRGRTRFWLTGRWHGVHDTCLRVAFDRHGKLVRYGLVELRGQASLQSHCADGEDAVGVDRPSATP